MQRNRQSGRIYSRDLSKTKQTTNSHKQDQIQCGETYNHNKYSEKQSQGSPKSYYIHEKKTAIKQSKIVAKSQQYQIQTEINIAQGINSTSKTYSVKEVYNYNRKNQAICSGDSNQISYSDVRYESFNKNKYNDEILAVQTKQNQSLSFENFNNSVTFQENNDSMTFQENSQVQKHFNQEYKAKKSNKSFQNQSASICSENSLEYAVRQNISGLCNDNRQLEPYKKGEAVIYNTQKFGDSLSVYENPAVKNTEVVKKLSHINNIFKNIENLKKQQLTQDNCYKIHHIEKSLIEIERKILRTC